jgi:hypothetical protein
MPRSGIEGRSTGERGAQERDGRVGARAVVRPVRQQSPLGGLLESVFDEQVQVVALIEDLASHVRIERREPADLAVLLGHELLVQGRDLDVEIEIPQVEVRRESLRRIPVAVPVDLEGRRFVVPVDLIEVQELRELTLAVMSEVDLFVGQSRLGSDGGFLGAVRYD